MLAGVSLDYYARLEQGRDLQPSDQVLDSMARALRMSEVERVHLHHLVRGTVFAQAADGLRFPPLRAGTRLLIEGLAAPALVLDVRGEVHAMNRLGEALLAGLAALPSGSANHTRWLFFDHAARDLLVDWEVVARSSVHVLREAAGRYPRDPVLKTLVAELADVSPEFRTWWAEHDVAERCHGLKRFHHPVVGDLELHVEALELADDGRWLYTYLPEPDSASEQSMRLLSSWAATSPAPASTSRLRPTAAAAQRSAAHGLRQMENRLLAPVALS